MGVGSWGNYNIGSAVIFSGYARTKYGGGSYGSNNNEPEEKEPKHTRTIRLILTYLLYSYFVLCSVYTIYKYVNREVEFCGIVENKYSIPYYHQNGNVTYENYILINRCEILVSNDVYSKYNVGANICIKYTPTFSLNIHQAIGFLVIIYIALCLIAVFFGFIFFNYKIVN